jgi:hypothetical protein
MNRVRVGILVTSVLVLLPALLWASDPASALAALESGNERLVADASSPQPIGHDRRAGLAKGQTPFATVLSGADSRVPPEPIVNVGPGDLFVVRAAGEVRDTSVLASTDYAVEHAHTPLLVVMDHEFRDAGGRVCFSLPIPEGRPATRVRGDLDISIQ